MVLPAKPGLCEDLAYFEGELGQEKRHTKQVVALPGQLATQDPAIFLTPVSTVLAIAKPALQVLLLRYLGQSLSSLVTAWFAPLARKGAFLLHHYPASWQDYFRYLSASGNFVCSFVDRMGAPSCKEVA